MVDLGGMWGEDGVGLVNIRGEMGRGEIYFIWGGVYGFSRGGGDKGGGINGKDLEMID